MPYLLDSLGALNIWYKLTIDGVIPKHPTDILFKMILYMQWHGPVARMMDMSVLEHALRGIGESCASRSYIIFLLLFWVVCAPWYQVVFQLTELSVL